MVEWAGREATRYPPEGFSLTDDDAVRRPPNWGAVEIGIVTIMWEPATEKDDYPALDARRRDIESKYQKVQEDAQKEHDEAVAAAEGRLETARNRFGEAGDLPGQPSERERERAITEAESAYEVEVLAADDNLVLKAWPAGREVERELAESLRVLFKAAPDRFVVYRRDKDLWAEADRAEDAAELASDAIEDYRDSGQYMIEGVSRTQRAARAGAVVARFPGPPGRATSEEERERIRRFLREYPVEYPRGLIVHEHIRGRRVGIPGGHGYEEVYVEPVPRRARRRY